MQRTSHEKHLVSPYSFSLTCVFLMLLLIGDAIIIRIWFNNTKDLPISAALVTGDAFGSYLLITLTLLAVAVFIFNAYDYWSIIEICEDRIVLRAPLRKPLTFMYEDVNNIGIDYGLVSGKKQFWIFISKCPVDKKFTHNILHLPYSASTMRIQYRKSVYMAIMRIAPYDIIGKQLCRSHSVIRVYRAEE